MIACFALGISAVTLLAETSWASLTKQSKTQSQTKQSQAQSQTGTVRIEFVKAGLIVGVGSGSGTLVYRGKTYQLTVGGIDVGSVGITSVQLAGYATNLRSGADIAGTYSATGSAATIGNTSGVATVRNEKDVVLKLRVLQRGFQASLGLSGMTITLQQTTSILLR
jgi:hypothetical protein